MSLRALQSNIRDLRKRLLAAGLEEISVSSVQIQTNQMSGIKVNTPAVFYDRAADRYFVVGQMVESNPNSMLQELSHTLASRPDAPETANVTEIARGNAAAEVAAAADIPEDDITLVMGQADCTREAAVEALRLHPGDYVAAIQAAGEQQ